MVAPITGPTPFTINQNPLYYSSGVRYKQAMPVDRPLPYEQRAARKILGTGTYAGLTAQGMLNDARLPLVPTNSPVYTEAYTKLLAKVRPSVSLGAALAEASSSIAMIAGRALQLVQAARAIRRLDLAGAARALGCRKVDRSKRSVRQDLQGMWLEYAFGWKPLVMDMYGASEVLQHSFEPAVQTSHASEQIIQTLPTSIPWGNVTYETVTASRGVKMGCRVRINNPNLFLMNQLGLVNPASVAWELVPFSFVADWLGNFSVVINSYTDWLGCTPELAYTTWYYKGSRELHYWYNHVKYGFAQFYHVRTQRMTSLVLPTFGIYGMRLPGWQGMLTRVSTLGVIADILRRK